ncbi:MAG: LPS-assembly protein LptD [Synergistaceae bacterium]|nr:LPS-assembly protein LptD [Synergistaceae bacterium]
MDKAVKIAFKFLIFILILNLNINIACADADIMSEEAAAALLNNNNINNNERVILNANRVSYNDITGTASAQGKAVLTYKDAKVEAERIDYNSKTQKIEAMPLPGDVVKLSSQGRTVTGDHLDYDLNTREGVLQGAKTNLAAGAAGSTLYVYGGQIVVIPWETAVEKGLIKGKSKGASDFIAQWRDVTLTTCELDHPHYRLVSKRIAFIPGKSVIAKRPRLYLGRTYLFTSPFDYVVSLEKKAMKYSLMPHIHHSSKEGFGGGITGSLGWDTGSLSFGIAAARKTGLEWMLELEQELSREFTIMVGVDYSWDEVWNERVWRPRAALTWAKNGWQTRLRWTHDEYIEDQKDSMTKYKGRLDRKPELTVKTPWFRTSPYSWLNLTAIYGAYSEEIYGASISSTTRYGLEMHSYFEKDLWPSVILFSDMTGGVWFYDRYDADQEMLRSFTGLKYGIGSIELATAYERRYTWGESAMLWDQFKERERIHQKIRFPLSRKDPTTTSQFYFAFRGSYDLDEKMVDKAIYSLQWVIDCMRWDLHYINDRAKDGDDKIGLTMSVNAFPNTPASFGDDDEKDPFDRPSDLPEK